MDSLTTIIGLSKDYSNSASVCQQHSLNNEAAFSCKTSDITSGMVAVEIPTLLSGLTNKSPITQLENMFTFVTFVILGTAAMAFWNTMIGSLYSVQKYIYTDTSNISDTITAFYTTLSLITTAVLIKFQNLNPKLLYVGAIGFIICCLGIPMTCTWVQGASGVLIYHLLAALSGSCTACFESSMFGFASILPRNYVGGACLGLGLSGLVSFFSWMILSKSIFSMSRIDVLKAMWCHLSLAAILNIIAMIFFFVVQCKPWAIDAMKHALLDAEVDSNKSSNSSSYRNNNSAEDISATASNKKTLHCDQKRLYGNGEFITRDENGDHVKRTIFLTQTNEKLSNNVANHNNNNLGSSHESLRPSCSRRSRWDIFKDASEQIFNVSFTLWLTLMMFPNIAPFAWGRPVIETDILLGVFQCGDFIGRYIPNLRRWVSCVAIHPKKVKYFALSRLLFIPLFVVPFKLSTTSSSSLLGELWFQILCIFAFAVSSGWICSLSSMYVPESVEDTEEKGQAATMYLLMLLLGITVGLWMTKLWKL